MPTDYTISLSDELQTELELRTAEANAMPGVTQPMTPAQFLRREVRERLRVGAARRADQERVRMRDIYRMATPDDKAVMDALIVKYRGT